MKRAAFLKDWREKGLQLSVEFVSSRAGLTESELREIEDGVREPYVDELGPLARVLSLKLEQVLPEEIPSTRAPEPIRMLLTSSEDFRPSEQTRAVMADAARAALDLLELQPRKIGAPKFDPSPMPPNTSKPAYVLGDALAKRVRAHFKIAGPIESMHQFATDLLGIPVLGAHLGEYGPDAFTVYAPKRRSVIVLNLSVSSKNSHHLARRFTLAHEIGHALFDRPANGSAYGVACAVSQERKLGEEMRANAFAMRLLLPERELKKLGNSIFEPVVFRRVMAEWGVHFAALRLYTQKLHDLSADEAKRRVPVVDASSPLRWREAETLPCEQTPELTSEVPLHRREPLMALAFDAYENAAIGAGELRSLLGVDSSVLPVQVAAVLGRSLDGI